FVVQAFYIPSPSMEQTLDVARLDRAEVIDELVNEDLVADIERLFHGRRRYIEGLHDKALDEERDNQGDNYQDRQLAPERPVLRPSWSSGIGVLAGLAVLGSVIRGRADRAGR